jgi:hypothetical protein
MAKTETVRTALATYEQLGRYSYTIETSPSPLNLSDVIGPVYPESMLEGDGPPPIFTRLARKIHILFVYKLSNATDVSGNVSADLTIRAGESWSQRIPLAEPSAFTGAVGGVEATIDLLQITSLLSQIRQQTGLESDRVELNILPRVEVDGVAGGQRFHDSFLHPLTFIYTEDLIVPDEELAYAAPGEITVTSLRMNEMNILGAGIPVSTVRTLVTPTAIAAVTLTAVVAWTWFYGERRPEDALLRPDYLSSVVPITDVEAIAGYRVTVESFLDLLQMARDKKKPLLVKEFEAGQVYLVSDGMTMFQHVVGVVPTDWMRLPQPDLRPAHSLDGPTARDFTPPAANRYGEPQYSNGRTENRLPGKPAYDDLASDTADFGTMDAATTQSGHELAKAPASSDHRELASVTALASEAAVASPSETWRSQPQTVNQVLTTYAKKWLRDFLRLSQTRGG